MNKLIPKEYRDSYFRGRNKKRDYNATIIMGVVWLLVVALVVIVPTI